MRRTRATVVALLTALALTGLASCSGDDGPDDGASTAGASEGAGGSGQPSEAAPAPALDRPRPALKALKIKACPPGEGELVARGTVKNREKKPIDFVVTVDWLDEKSQVAVSKVVVVEDVPPRERAQWEVAATPDRLTTSCNARAASGKLRD